MVGQEAQVQAYDTYGCAPIPHNWTTVTYPCSLRLMRIPACVNNQTASL